MSLKTIPEIDAKQISDMMHNLAASWDFCGATAFYYGDKEICREYFGADEKTPFLLSLSASFLQGVALLKLEQDGKLSLEDTLDKYLPQYRYADKIKIKYLLSQESNIPCCFYSGVMIKLNADPAHAALSFDEKYAKEKLCAIKELSADEAAELINDKPLEGEPGEFYWRNTVSDRLFSQVVIEKASGMSCFDYMKREIFVPLGMDNTRCEALPLNDYYDITGSDMHTVTIRPQPGENYTGFAVTDFADIKKLALGITQAKILTKKSWKKAFKFSLDGVGLGFTANLGSVGARSSVLGNYLRLYFEQDTGYCSVTAAFKGVKSGINEAGYEDSFLYALKRGLDAFTTYPRKTSLKKVNRRNVWEAMDLEVLPHQRFYVDDARSSLAYCATDRTNKPYLLSEGAHPIGLCVLLIDKKKEEYAIEIVLIDKRYQARGFGRIMINEAVKILKKAGAKTLEIGVARENVAAQKLYISAGFSPYSISEGGMLLRMEV